MLSEEKNSPANLRGLCPLIPTANLLVDNYSVFYVIWGQQVLVTNVLYSASDIEQWLKWKKTIKYRKVRGKCPAPLGSLPLTKFPCLLPRYFKIAIICYAIL